ncbi:MAG: PQQ-binding-like beta-propeller repeat protein [Candidatus Thermoplasmatota archaeon]|nr:PQQ-binding-like beta-propeller repeat protein [Candidatus Thermoplasmatota archaeon]
MAGLIREDYRFQDSANDVVINDDATSDVGEPVIRSTSGNSWSMFGYDQTNSFNYPNAAPETNDVIWNANFAADFSASPAVIDGLIYVGGTDYYLYCIDANTGEEVFKIHLPSQVVSSPCVVGDMIYVGCRDRNLYAFNRETQNEEWKFTTGGDVDSSPKVVGDTVYFGSLDGYFYAVDTITHSLVWKYWCGEGYMVKSSPAISGNRLVFGSYNEDGSKGNITCLDLNGFQDGNDGYNGEGNTSETAGDVLWQYTPLKGVIGSASIMGDSVFIGSEDGKLHCLGLSDGSLLWDAATGDSIKSCPTPVPETNSVIFGSWDGFLYNLNASTGTPIWKEQLSGFISAPATVADGKVYVGDLSYNLYCFDLIGWGNLSTEKIFQIYTGLYMRCRAAPVIYNGILYQSCENGNNPNNGKIIAVGRPDVKVFDILFDDPTPYEGELVEIEVIVKNNDTIECEMDMEISYVGHPIKELIASEHLTVAPLSLASINISWKARSGTWSIFVKVLNITPEDTTNTLFHLNAQVLTVSSPPTKEWNFFMGGVEHECYSAIAVDTNREEGSAFPGGSLFQPVISKGFLLVTTTAGSLLAFDQYDLASSHKWRVDFPDPALSSASVLGDKIFVPYEGFKLRCFDLMDSGNLLWTYDNPGIEDPIAPVMAKHGIVFVTTESGQVFAIDDDDGELLWQTDIGANSSTIPLLFGDNFTVLDDSGKIYLLDLYDGTILATKVLGSTLPMTPAYFDDRIFVVFTDGDIVSYDPVSNTSTLLLELADTPTTCVVKVSEDGRLALGTVSGVRILDEKYAPVGIIEGVGSLNSPLVGGPGRCYFIDSTGTLYGMNMSSTIPSEERFLWNMTLGASTNGTPVVWEGKVYISTAGGEIYALGAANNAPKGIIDSPASMAVYKEIDEIEFSAASSNDPNRDELRYKWTSTLDGLLYDGPLSAFKTYLSPGLHEIKLTVDDQRGGKDHKIITISVLGREIETTLFPSLDIDLRVANIGGGDANAELKSGLAGVNNNILWNIVAVTTDYPWMDWMEIRFDLTIGSNAIPENADADSIRLYYMNSTNGNWIKYNDSNVEFIPGKYISINFTNPEGGTAELILSLYGNILDVIFPTANAGPDQSVDRGSTVTFDGNGSYDNVGIQSLVWTFNDVGEKILYGFDPTYTFNNSGNFSVTLKVTDTSGNGYTDTMNVVVNNTIEKPVPPVEDGEGQWLWVVILVLAICLIAVFIIREIKSRKEEQRKFDEFFKEGREPDKAVLETDDRDVDSYVDMFTVGGSKKDKGGREKKVDSLPDETIGGMKIRKPGSKK